MDNREEECLKSAITILQDILAKPEKNNVIPISSLQRRGMLSRTARIRFEARHRRRAILGAHLSSETCWDIMLDLYIAGVDGIRLCVTDIGHATGTSNATLIRWLQVLALEGMTVRTNDPNDGRRVWLNLSRRGVDKVEECLASEEACRLHFLTNINQGEKHSLIN
jgi:DNA-binding MarR family transcriptional regulator